jgi:glycosyltransferase involved in cell wall biosynthesis
MILSVIVIVYNGASTIHDCLRAICNQQGYKVDRDYEVVVVNDGSTDDTSEIAAGFPVRMIDLGQNKGRVEARKAGAESAICGQLLFVDSRITVDSDLVAAALREAYSPVIAGYFYEDENKYASVFNTIFYLIRKKYYGSAFANPDSSLVINKDNFHQSPKGTTILFIDRQVFLNSVPREYGVYTNDDTKLFEHIVFEQDKEIRRSSNIRAHYSQRSAIRELIPWLYYRGIRFSDYYLTRGGRYRGFYLAMAAALLVAAVLLFLYPLIVLAGTAVLIILLSLYLSGTVRDFLACLLTLPLVIGVFGAGTARYWIMPRGKNQN